MFESIIKSKLKAVIKEKMINNKYEIKLDELIELINSYTDNELNIKWIMKYNNLGNERPYLSFEVSK